MKIAQRPCGRVAISTEICRHLVKDVSTFVKMMHTHWELVHTHWELHVSRHWGPHGNKNCCFVFWKIDTSFAGTTLHTSAQQGFGKRRGGCTHPKRDIREFDHTKWDILNILNRVDCPEMLITCRFGVNGDANTLVVTSSPCGISRNPLGDMSTKRCQRCRVPIRSGMLSLHLARSGE